MISFLAGPLVGFGLAPIKQEGMCFSPSDPNIPPWHGYHKEFREYFAEKCSPWYLKWLSSIFRNIAQDAWDSALLENAKKKYLDNPP